MKVCNTLFLSVFESFYGFFFNIEEINQEMASESRVKESYKGPPTPFLHNFFQPRAVPNLNYIIYNIWVYNCTWRNGGTPKISGISIPTSTMFLVDSNNSLNHVTSLDNK